MGRTGRRICSATSRRLLNEAPRIYAPYQPRFDWNLWFWSLSDWQQSEIVPQTEERLLENDARCAGVVSGQSVWAGAAAVCARGAVAVLVYFAGGEAADGELVARQYLGCMRRS